QESTRLLLVLDTEGPPVARPGNRSSYLRQHQPCRQVKCPIWRTSLRGPALVLPTLQWWRLVLASNRVSGSLSDDRHPCTPNGPTGQDQGSRLLAVRAAQASGPPTSRPVPIHMQDWRRPRPVGRTAATVLESCPRTKHHSRMSTSRRPQA